MGLSSLWVLPYTSGSLWVISGDSATCLPACCCIYVSWVIFLDFSLSLLPFLWEDVFSWSLLFSTSFWNSFLGLSSGIYTHRFPLRHTFLVFCTAYSCVFLSCCTASAGFTPHYSCTDFWEVSAVSARFSTSACSGVLRFLGLWCYCLPIDFRLSPAVSFTLLLSSTILLDLPFSLLY